MLQESLLPKTAPGVRGKGPVVPGTAGLRVTSGYFARARMGAVDLHLSYTMASFLRGEDQAFLRLEAHGDKVGPSQTAFHAFIPLAMRLDEDVTTLTSLTLEKEALADAKANIRVATRTRRHNRLVELHRVTFDIVQSDIITGTLEGTTKRGSRATSALPFQVGFVAYRGPDMGMVGPPRETPESDG